VVGTTLVALATSGCGPHIPPGPAVVEDAAKPIVVEVVEDSAVRAPRIEVVLLAGGSRWDPPGLEGRSALALSPPHPRNPGLQVTVGRDHASLIATCGPDPTGASGCVAWVQDALSGSTWASPALDAPARRYWTDQRLLTSDGTALAVELLFTLLYEAHPYGHPTLGRHGTLPSITAAQVAAFFPTQVVRAAVRARVVGADAATAALIAERLAVALEAIPAGMPPDPAMKAPPPPARVIAVGAAPGQGAFVAVGVALPRPATATTRAEPSPDEVSRWAHLRACAAPVLQAAGLALVALDEAPPGWEPALSTPAHPALIGVASDSPHRVASLVRELPEAIAAAVASEPACEGGDVDIGEVLSPRTLTAVVLWPAGVEDPWPAIVEAGPWTALVRLPAAPEDLLR
jgi:hypothetical protein